MNQFKIYEVGGKVRDDLLGISCNDIDYLIVIDNEIPAQQAFTNVQSYLKESGFVIFSVKQDYWTIRCKFPKDHPTYPKVTADFQLAVKDGQTCTLADNLRERDFTVNAMAKDVETGEIVDLFDSRTDLHGRFLRCPVNGEYTMTADPIRLVRALRLAYIDGYKIEPWGEVFNAIEKISLDDFKRVNVDRLYRELRKMFKSNVLASLQALQFLQSLNPVIYRFIFDCIKLNPVVIKGQ